MDQAKAEALHAYPFFAKLGYFECGDGWFAVLEGLAQRVEKGRKAKRIQGTPKASQVKEKFGRLRIYTAGYDPVVDSLIKEAEEASWTVCEVCGKAGTLRRRGGWLSTLCDAHAEPSLCP